MSDWREAATEHARAEYPREACGLVVVVKGRARYWPCRNIAETNEQFVVDPRDYAAAEDSGEVVGVFHSHPASGANPSEADLVGCERSGVEWHILAWPSGVWRSLKPSGYVAPLVGREFHHGVLDCYSLVRDWYRQERGVDLIDFDRSDVWWERGQNLYVEGYEAAGFRAVDPAEMSHGDVLLMQIQSPVPNHAAVYLGDGMILHHLYGRLSSRDIWGGYYQHVTTHVLRYDPRGSTVRGAG